MALAVAVRASGHHSVVTVAGELDCATAPCLRGFLFGEIEESQRDLVVDFLDAAGLNVLVNARLSLALSGRELSVLCHGPRILWLFVITGLYETLNVNALAETGAAPVDPEGDRGSPSRGRAPVTPPSGARTAGSRAGAPPA